MSTDPQVALKVLDPRLPGWGFPHWGSAEAAGLDLHACLDTPLILEPGGPPVLVSAGFAMRIGEPGWCGLIVPRSGLGHRGLVLGNAVGIVDADYEGPVTVSAWNRNPPSRTGGAITIAPGDRLAQLVFVRVARPDFTFVDDLIAPNARGAGGFGSTGVAATVVAFNPEPSDGRDVRGESRSGEVGRRRD